MFRLALYTAVLIGAIQVLGQDSEYIDALSSSFRPTFINLKQGQLLEMQLWGPNPFSLRESTFEDPCTWGGSFWSLNVTGGDRSVMEYQTYILDVWSGLGDSKPNPLWFFNAESDYCKMMGVIFVINPPNAKAVHDATERAKSGEVLSGDKLVTSFYPLTTIPTSSSASASSTPTPSTTSSGSPSNSTGGSNDNDDAAVSLTVGKAIITATVMGIVVFGVVF
ncbi:hypothetical protein QCA50_004010 [Cerrena zonata]|uniref:Uncharacterized protein n=1 Tax=Cerrena zonata TaxID=2478898 RepID=A0AAW0GGD6_9APHY